MDTRDLDDNVHRLTRPHMLKLERDNITEYITVNSLLDQLREAVYPGAEKGNNTGGRPAAAALNALDLLLEITKTATYYWAFTTRTHITKLTVEGRIKAWAADSRSGEDAADNVKRAARITSKWISQIEALFDPPKQQDIVASCPECGKRWVWIEEDGQKLRRAALTLHPGSGGSSYAECGRCGTKWGSGQLELLARVISDETRVSQQRN